MNDGLLKCVVCKNRKTPGSFYADATRSTGRMSRCKTCDGNLKKRRYNRRQDGRRDLLNRAKQAACMDCGREYPPYVMDLDHRPGTDKLFNLSNALRFSVREILAELDKCDPVCANCHRKRTHQRGQPAEPDDE